MGDDELGDFFAKKDKRKNKKTAGKVTAATLIEQFAVDKSAAEETSAQYTPSAEASIARPDDNEWIEINDDVSEGLENLKIKSLDTKKEEEEEVQQEEQEVGSDGEEGTEEKGPWAPLSSTPPKLVRGPISTAKTVPSIPSGLLNGGKYVPPSQRQAGAGQPVRVRGREQLNVNSVDQFPQLGANRTHEKHDPSFDTVKGGSRKAVEQRKQESMQLSNKFGVLQS